MTALPVLALVVLVSYLVGAIPFGYLVARCRGVDILRHGSGNIGATNVGRILGPRWGLVVFLLDFAKGVAPTLSATFAKPIAELPLDTLPVAAGVAAFLGHLFPVYLRFHGGKGVATGAGVVTVLMPVPALAALLTWAVVLTTSRFMSLASLTAAALLCALRLFTTPWPWGADHVVTTTFCLVAVALIFVRHHANFRRLLHGTENRLKDSSTMTRFSKTLHVLALGLWFGTVVFFTFVVGLSLFGTFEKVATAEPRPIWFPLPDAFKGERPSPGFPEPLRKEQGTQAAGAAVGALFPWYFGIQTVCGLVTLATACSWSCSLKGARVHRVRTWVLFLALLAVVAGWWLDHVVHKLGGPRNDTTNATLLSPSPSAEMITSAEAARHTFVVWHLVSLLVNFITLGLVTVGMALAAQLPSETGYPVVNREQQPGSEGQPSVASR